MKKSKPSLTYISYGEKFGSLTRYISPSDTGELTKPFVLLDYIDIKKDGIIPYFGFHPHSGVATFTYLIEGESVYEETSGNSGILEAGGAEWMCSGSGVWHRGGPRNPPVRGIQLWIALPPELERTQAKSQHIERNSIPSKDGLHVLLGKYNELASPVASPGGINLFLLKMQNGENWRHIVGENNITWILPYKGRIKAGGVLIEKGQLAAFESLPCAIDLSVPEDSEFFLATAPKHPYPLILGRYSVHTEKANLEASEANILKIGRTLGLL